MRHGSELDYYAPFHTPYVSGSDESPIRIKNVAHPEILARPIFTTHPIIDLAG